MSAKFLRIAASALFVAAAAAAGGCADYPAWPVPAVLNDREAVRLAELHLNDVAPESSPRDVVSVDPMGERTLVAFQTLFDETQRPPKTSRLVLVDHDGDVRELRFMD